MSDSSYFHWKRPFATGQVAVSSSPVSFPAATVDNTANYPDFKCSAVIIECRTDDVYYTLDGSTPSSTNGIQLQMDQFLPLAGYQKIKNFKAVRVTTDATLNVQYFKD